MKNLKIATVIVLILMITLPMIPAGADVDITVTTDGDVDLEVSTNGNGALLSVDYNGRDLLAEIEGYLKTISDLRSAIIALAMRNDVADLESQLAALEEALNKLIDELNLVLNDLYYNLNAQAHVIGINPGNTTVAITLINGNLTIADYLDGILINLNATEHEFTSIRLQFENVYSGMMVQDTVLMETRSDIRELNTTFSDAIVDLERFGADILDVISDVGVQLLDSDAQLQGQIDVQGMDIDELRQEVLQVHQELMAERTTRNNLTIMFVAFSVLVILLSVVSSRK